MERLIKRMNGKLTIAKEFPTLNDLVDVSANRLEIYEDAEEQGRLVILPCKIVDKVWRINDTKTAAEPIEITNINIHKIGICIYAHPSRYTWTINDIGKTVFLTREEAESALQESEDDTDER